MPSLQRVYSHLEQEFPLSTPLIHAFERRAHAKEPYEWGVRGKNHLGNVLELALVNDGYPAWFVGSDCQERYMADGPRQRVNVVLRLTADDYSDDSAEQIILKHCLSNGIKISVTTTVPDDGPRGYLTAGDGYKRVVPSKPALELARDPIILGKPNTDVSILFGRFVYTVYDEINEEFTALQESGEAERLANEYLQRYPQFSRYFK